MRYERKYRIDNLDLAELRQALRSHPLSFRKLFPDRQVNNIYLDTPDLHFFRENLDGVAERRKYRIRWYGPNLNFASKPVLEVKLKQAELGEKLSLHLDDIPLDGTANWKEISTGAIRKLAAQPVPALPEAAAEEASLFPGIVRKLEAMAKPKGIAPTQHGLVLNTRIVHPEMQLRPSLVNTYQRSYLISNCQKYRLTIDWQMRYHAFNARMQVMRQALADEALVVELKYEAEDDQAFTNQVAQHIPFRLGKNSKYVNGMLLLGNY
jgi:hypothetical protein